MTDQSVRTPIDGASIFFIMDTKGMPLDLINDVLREKGYHFDTVSFVKAALASGNFTKETIKTHMINAMAFDEKVRQEFSLAFDKVFV